MVLVSLLLCLSFVSSENLLVMQVLTCFLMLLHQTRFYPETNLLPFGYVSVEKQLVVVLHRCIFLLFLLNLLFVCIHIQVLKMGFWLLYHLTCFVQLNSGYKPPPMNQRHLVQMESISFCIWFACVSFHLQFHCKQNHQIRPSFQLDKGCE